MEIYGCVDLKHLFKPLGCSAEITKFYYKEDHSAVFYEVFKTLGTQFLVKLEAENVYHLP